ncbi:hypothetical protein E2C01_073832 [Portunus trituberculatus]|uniref:Uncharacterized protein n=1 Tax=Portunus trituberculatus TaxID=210409 RepID=A0A5B7I412_PORTR|nr:hypothetical protein [Portunus trituberculatus]
MKTQQGPADDVSSRAAGAAETSRMSHPPQQMEVEQALTDLLYVLVMWVVTSPAHHQPNACVGQVSYPQTPHAQVRGRTPASQPHSCTASPNTQAGSVCVNL